MCAYLMVNSPNYTAGRRGFKPEAIVIHIMEGSLSGTDSWFANPLSKVSAHFGVGQNGEIHQYVDTENTAWHAGRVNAPSWKLIKASSVADFINPNYYTIGIEHEGKSDTDWSDAMYNASAELIKALSARYNLPLDRAHIIGHHEIYSLKTCPGFKVDLLKLIALAGGAPPLAAAPIEPPKVAEAAVLITQSRLNIRSSPNRNLGPIGLVEAGIKLALDGYTNDGEAISGNSKWYYTNDNKWFWSGGFS